MNVVRVETESIFEKLDETFGKEVVAACLYGSQVSGYATAESDHDVLVVLEDYSPRVKYTYVEGGDGREIAFLAVDKYVLEEDVRETRYGGFIADRLINPLEPLINPSFIKEMEVERRKTIILWETEKLVLKKGLEAGYLDINLLYYPYKRWNKIARIYRPFLYSVESTLRPDLREANLQRVVPPWEEAVSGLDILRPSLPGWYRIKDDFIKERLGDLVSKRLERMGMMEREFEDMVARYLIHKKAGGSDRELLVKEAISKVKREVRHMMEKGGQSTLLDPKRFYF